MSRPPLSSAYPMGPNDPQQFANYAQLINSVQATSNRPSASPQSQAQGQSQHQGRGGGDKKPEGLAGIGNGNRGGSGPAPGSTSLGLIDSRRGGAVASGSGSGSGTAGGMSNLRSPMTNQGQGQGQGTFAVPQRTASGSNYGYPYPEENRNGTGGDGTSPDYEIDDNDDDDGDGNGDDDDEMDIDDHLAQNTNSNNKSSSAQNRRRQSAADSDRGDDGPASKKRKLTDAGAGSGNGKGKGAGGGGTVGSGGGGGEKEKEKRRRQVQSCSECRRRKIKCDKKFPCGPCTLRNDQAICREVEKHTPTTTGCASTQDLLNLQHRLSVMESLLAEAGILAPGTLDNLVHNPKSRSLAIQPPAVGTSVTAAGLPKADHQIGHGHGHHSVLLGMNNNGDDNEGESDTEGAALTLEHLAFGRRKTEQPGPGPNAHGPTYPAHQPHRSNSASEGDGNRRPSFSANPGMVPVNPGIVVGEDLPLAPLVRYQRAFDAPLPTTSTGGLMRDILPATPLNLKQRLTGPVDSSVLNALEPSEVFSVFYQRSDVYVKALLSVLPDHKRGELLVKQYLDRVEWLHRCLHVPTFMLQCQELWNTPLENIVRDVYTPFLSLYLMVICLGLYFMEPTEALSHFTQEEREVLPEIWLTACRGSLWMGDFMAVHTIEHLQTIVLVGVFLNNRDRADAAWSLLGAAIKMAQGMGLSRLGGEVESKPGVERPRWKSPWESLIKREVGRRLWWNLVFLDWSLAPSYNFNSSIQPDQIKTALPANVDDADIIEGQPLRPKPLSERTEMSYHLARLRFAEISQRQIWQANASPHPPYSFILSVDTEMRKAIKELPQYFACDFDNLEPPPKDSRSRIFYWEKIIVNLSGQSRLMRLHRPWLSRGYKDKKYDYSREQCIRAARNCLKLMSDDYGTAVVLERWWIPLFYVTVAAVVVLIDLLRIPPAQLNDRDSMAKEREVVKALAQIKQIEDMSHPAKGAVRVISQLLKELEEKRRGRPGEAEETEASNSPNGLQRAVQKLVSDANQNMHTGSGSGESVQTNTSPGIMTDGASVSERFDCGNTDGMQAPTAQHAATLQAGYGNLFDWDPNMAPSFAGFPMEGTSGNNTGLTPLQNNNYDNIDLESMLASFMPSRAPSPTPQNARENAASLDADALWPQVGANFDYGGGATNPYSGWMG